MYHSRFFVIKDGLGALIDDSGNIIIPFTRGITRMRSFTDELIALGF